METKKENKSFMNRVMVIALIIASGIAWAHNQADGLLIVIVSYGLLRTICGMINNNIDNKQFTKTTLNTWSRIILLPTMVYLIATATYILCSLIYASDITDWCHIIINTDKYAFLEPIAYIILEATYPDAIFISDVTTLGGVIACLGVFIYLVTAAACLFKRLFKEFFMIHLTMPLTGILMLIMEEQEYFLGCASLLSIVYITMFICCLFRKEFTKAIIALLVFLLSGPLMVSILEFTEQFTTYVIDNCGYFPIYIYIN